MSDVKEMPGPEPRTTSFSRVVGPSQDVENQGGAATASGVVTDENGGSIPSDGEDSEEKRMSVMTFLKIVTACSALYMATNPWFFFYDADKGEICPYTVICATSPLELALLTGSRMSAGILFASITIAIFSKNYATRSYVHHSWLGAVLDFEPTHDVHTYFGYLTLISGYEHGLLHCARHIVAGNSELIYDTDNGRSGMVACLLLLPIVLPMKFEFFRTRATFEFRKGLHMLFLLMLIAICFHSVVFRFVGSILIVWYILDRLYFTTKQTFLINHPVFEAVGKGTMVSFDLPEGYTFKAGSYIYVNSPTISRSEWHPFSIIQVPGLPPRAAVYVEAVGDWTKELFSLGLGQPRLPLWITAAQPSLMEKSIYFDNVVLVCTGAGITPAVSIIERFASRKNIHLMWMSRDGGIVALFEKQLKKVNSTVHLTGKPEENTKTALTRLFHTAAPRTTPSFRKAAWSVIRSNAFAPKGQSRMETMNETGDDGETKSDKPDTSAGRAIVDQEAISAKKLDIGQLRRRGSVRTMSKPAKPVTLVFGRPNIGKYLVDTFEKYTEMPTDASDFGASASMTSTERDVRRTAPGREGSVRLDESQKVSKELLMKADHTAISGGMKSARVGGSHVNGAGQSPGGPLPWLVLYCGANPKVEEAIAKTCDELRVNWQKEYFGAW